MQPDAGFTPHPKDYHFINVNFGNRFELRDLQSKQREDGRCGDNQEGNGKIEERITEKLTGVDKHLVNHDK